MAYLFIDYVTNWKLIMDSG